MKKIKLLTLCLLLSEWTDAQWQQTNGPYGGFIQCIAISGSSIFAGTAYNDGVFLSTNNGASWAPVNSGLSNTNVTSLVIVGNNIFAGTQGGVFMSANNGSSWSSVSSGISTLWILSLATNGTYIYAGTNAGNTYLS